MRTLQLQPRLRQHGVLVGKNCYGTNEIKSLQTSSFPSYYVRARKEGGMSSPLGLFSTYSNCWCLLPLEHSDYDVLSPVPRAADPTGIVQTQCQQVQFWQRAKGITQSEAKPTIHHLPCFVSMKHSLVWFMRKSLVSSTLPSQSTIWETLPSVLKQPENCDSYRFGLCTEMPRTHPLQFQPSQQPLRAAGLSSKSLPASQVLSTRSAKRALFCSREWSRLSLQRLSLSSKDEENRPESQTCPPKCNA